MKRKIGLSITGLFSLLLLFNCKKDKTGNNPPARGPLGLKVKILEYGSDIPLPKVYLTASTCIESGKYGCTSSLTLGSWTSGMDGIINISINEYPKGDVSYSAYEADHWIKVEDPIFDTLIHKPSYDSAVIRLYPFARINFHIKSVNSYGAKEWLRTYMEVVPDNKGTFEIDPPLYDMELANNFDKVFIFKTYGNVKNRLICTLLDSNYVVIKKLYDETIFIPKTFTQPWTVNF